MRDEQRSFESILRGEMPPMDESVEDPEFEAWMKMQLEQADLEYNEEREKKIATREQAAGSSSGPTLPP